MSSTDFDTGQGTIIPGADPPPVAAAETTLDRTKTPESPVPVGVVPHASDIPVEERLDRIEAAFTQRLNINLYEFDTTANRAVALQTATDAVVSDLGDQQASAEAAGTTLPVTPGNISVVTNADGGSTTMWEDGTSEDRNALGEVTKPRATSAPAAADSGAAPTDAPEAPSGANVGGIGGYDSQTVPNLSPQIAALDEANLNVVEAYEIANANRVTVLNAVGKRRVELEAAEDAPA